MKSIGKLMLSAILSTSFIGHTPAYAEYTADEVSDFLQHAGMFGMLAVTGSISAAAVTVIPLADKRNKALLKIAEAGETARYQQLTGQLRQVEDDLVKLAGRTDMSAAQLVGAASRLSQKRTRVRMDRLKMAGQLIGRSHEALKISPKTLDDIFRTNKPIAERYQRLLNRTGYATAAAVSAILVGQMVILLSPIFTEENQVLGSETIAKVLNSLSEDDQDAIADALSEELEAAGAQ